MKYLLYNPLSNSNRGKEKVEALLKEIGNAKLVDVTKTTKEDLRNLCAGLDVLTDAIYLVGGDGTLQRFANIVYGLELPPVTFYGSGTGNDFLRDIKGKQRKAGAVVNQYIKNLPLLTIGDTSLRFVNGIGFGLDGTVCELADQIKAKSNRKISYSLLALKCCLYAYQKRDAKITVDGVTKEYKNVWICPTMKGRYFGGGMMVAPKQDRQNDQNTVSLVVGYTKSRLKLLSVLPTLKMGGLKESRVVDVYNAKSIKVEFSTPCALQVDGETYLNVKGYQVEV